MTRQKPTRSEGGQHDDYEEKHPAYAVIGASRVTSTPGSPLFGSDFRHQNYVVVRVRHASMKRGLAHDWVHADGRFPIVEVALSESQWATFLTTMNVGEGVPATLLYGEDGPVPGIEPDSGRREQFNAEIDDRLQTAIKAIDDVVRAGKLRKSDEDVLRIARANLSGNLDYVVRSFDEHAEKTVEKAKTEVAAYVEGTLRRAGLTAIAGGAVLELAEGEE